VTEYEQLRGGLGDGAGRTTNADVVFSFRDKDKGLAAAAQRRALAVLRMRHTDELKEIFEAEYRALAARQGYEEVEVIERKMVKRNA
jgi:hypothetical protein